MLAMQRSKPGREILNPLQPAGLQVGQQEYASLPIELPSRPYCDHDDTAAKAKQVKYDVHHS